MQAESAGLWTKDHTDVLGRGLSLSIGGHALIQGIVRFTAYEQRRSWEDWPVDIGDDVVGVSVMLPTEVVP
jgi:hypothetical protein